MSKKDDDGYVARDRERQNKKAVECVRKTAKRAGEIAEHTSAYDAQRKNPPNWPKPSKS